MAFGAAISMSSTVAPTLMLAQSQTPDAAARESLDTIVAQTRHAG